jgi:hypothetical protein
MEQQMTPGQQFVRKLFSSSPKSTAIETAVLNLMALVGRNRNQATAELFSALLCDIETDLLINGLGRALGEATEWMTPAQLRELCIGMSQAENEQQLADDAFGWAMNYLRNHGVNGRVKPGRLLGYEEGDLSQTPKFAPNTPAPEIPTAISAALAAIGGTPRQGLERLNLATASEMSFIKREFAQAFSRARRAE